ncbi:MAG: hypothetical protein ABFD64_05370 [Armatimonadota bacterium]
MPTYEITGRSQETHRKRKRTYKAFDDSVAVMKATSDGLIVENIILVPDEMPTARQLGYAHSLGLEIPTDPTKEELSDLIDCHESNDKPATDRHRGFAAMYRVYHTRCTGKKELFDRIYEDLKQPGFEYGMASWFTYRVYRSLVHGKDNVPIQGPDHPIITEISTQLISNESFIPSLREYNGRDLIWFGYYKAPNGRYYSGGNVHTSAYKQALQSLCQMTGLKASSDISGEKGKAGCFCCAPAALVICLLLIIVWALIKP